MHKFQLPAITKEMNEKRNEDKIRKFFKDEILKFFTYCAETPYRKIEGDNGFPVADLFLYPEDKVQQCIDDFVDSHLTSEYEHHGQVEFSKSERKQILWGISERPAYVVKFTYTPQFL